MRRLLFRRSVWLTLTLVLLLVPPAWFFNRRTRIERERQSRQAHYESVLRSYTETFIPGATRIQIETHLRNNGREILHMCCMNATHNAYDTLTKIGEERAPWYCSEYRIYVGFQFSAQGAHKGPAAHDSDVLTRIQIYPWLTGCL
jgi:hypothetical protein